MSALVPGSDIEGIVGVPRHITRHYARAVSREQTVYVLHSHECRSTDRDLRDCLYSQALDRGIDESVWAGHEDQPVRVTIGRSGRLIPVAPGMRLAR